MTRPAALLAAVASLTLAVPAGAAFDIVLNPDAGLSANGAALAAFNRAAAQWESRFTDDILVTINAGLSNLGSSSIIGSASSVALQAGYGTIRNQLVADAGNEPSNAIVAFLPTTFVATAPAGKTINASIAFINKANAKAAGFSGLDASFGASDGTITFNSTFSFDYDNSNGVSGSQIDFESVAVHEIGHVLGFVSSVDDFDEGATSTSPLPLDFFRFANNVAGQDPTTAAEFQAYARNMVPGTDAIFDDTANEYRFSTGANTGDGGQASHWKDDNLTGVYIGNLDPTIGFGQITPITNADLRAFDLIGYDLAVIPEPATLAVLGGAMAVALRRRRPVG